MVLTAFAFTFLIFALLWLFGHGLMTLMKIDAKDSDLRQAYAVASGTAVFSAMLFLLCLLHFYNLTGFLIGTVLLVALSVLVLRGSLFDEIKQIGAGITKGSIAAAGTIFLVTLPGFLLAPLPPFYKDTLIYHLYIPKLMIKTGTFVDIPGLSNTNFPLGMELIQGVGLMIGAPEMARVLHYFFFWMLLFVTWRIGNRFGKWCGPVAALVTALTPSMQIVATWAYIDIALAMFTLTILAALCDEKLTGKNRGLAFIGILLGFTLWMKFLSLYLAAYASVLLFVAMFRQTEKPGKALTGTILMGVVAGVCASPWYLKNLIQTGNPVYPYFTNLFGGKLFWNEFYNNAYFHLLSGYGYGEGVARYLLAPWYMIRYAKFESGVYDGVIGWAYLPLFLLVVLGTIGFRKRPVLVQVLTLATFLGYVLWLTNSQQMRFLLPTIALVPVLGVAEAAYRFKARQARLVLLGVIALLALGGLGQIGQYFKSINPIDYLAGKESRHEFLMRIDPLHPSYTFINENLPEDSSIFLVLVKNKRFYLERDCYSDSIFEHFTLEQAIRETGSTEGLHVWMKKRPFTHILFDRFYLPKALEAKDMAVFKDFVEKYTHPVFRDKYYLLVEIL